MKSEIDFIKEALEKVCCDEDFTVIIFGPGKNEIGREKIGKKKNFPAADDLFKVIVNVCKRVAQIEIDSEDVKLFINNLDDFHFIMSNKGIEISLFLPSTCPDI